METPTTIKVYLIVSFLVGQLTFFISSRTSFKKTISFLGKLAIFIVLKMAFSATNLMITD